MGVAPSAPGDAAAAAAAAAAAPHPTARVQTAKRQIEVYYRDLATRTAARQARKARVDKLEVSTEEKRRLMVEQAAREMEFVRRRREVLGVGDFDFVRKIGQGSYGEVFLVRGKGDGRLYALKKVAKAAVLKARCVSHVWLERFVFATCGNRSFVCRMEGSFQDRAYLYFLCEYLPGGDLLSMLIRDDTLPEAWARTYIAEIIVALDSLHRTGIIHRDVKPDNVIFGQHGHIRLADFGLSKSLLHVPPPGVVIPVPQQPEPPPGFGGGGGGCGDAVVAGVAGSMVGGPVSGVLTPQYLDHVRMGAGARVDIPIRRRLAAWKAVARLSVFSTVGTPNYIAPEVVQQRSYHEAADWWSVGCILYEMLVGFPPFWAADVADTCAMIVRADEHLAFPDRNDPTARQVSHEAEDLVRRLLVVDPAARLGARRGLDEFKEHPFFECVEWDTLDELRAPFVPTLTSETDTRYFDDDVTCQGVPPPPVCGRLSSDISSRVEGGAAHENGVRREAAEAGADGVFAEDDLSFASSTVSRVTVHRGDGSGGSVPASATAPSSRRTEEASSPFDIPAPSRPRKRTRRIQYEARCIHPEFVGFTYINDAQPFRRPITSDLFRPPPAKAETGAWHARADDAREEAGREKYGPSGSGRSGAGAGSTAVDISMDGNRAESLRTPFAPSLSASSHWQSRETVMASSPAVRLQQQSSLRTPLVDAGSEAEDDILFDADDDYEEESASSNSGDSDSFESERFETEEAEEGPARNAGEAMLGVVGARAEGEERVQDTIEPTILPFRLAGTSDGFAVAKDKPVANVDSTPPRDQAYSSERAEARRMDSSEDDDGRPLRLVEEETEDPLGTTVYENEDLLRLFSAALNMPGDKDEEAASLAEPETPPSFSQPLSRFQTMPNSRSVSRMARHSRQASLQLPVSPVTGSAHSAACLDPLLSSSRLEMSRRLPGQASNSRFGTFRPTHARRTDAGQQSICITSPPVGLEDGPEDKDVVESGLYSGQQSSSGPLHALEVAAALGEAAAAVSSSRQGSPQPASCLGGQPNSRLPSLTPLPLQVVAGASGCPVLHSRPGSQRSSPAPRPLGGRPASATLPLSPLAVVATPPMPTGIDAGPASAAAEEDTEVKRKESSGSVSSKTPPPRDPRDLRAAP